LVEKFELIKKDKNIWVVLIILGAFTATVFCIYLCIGMGKKTKNKYLE